MPKKELRLETLASGCIICTSRYYQKNGYLSVRINGKTENLHRRRYMDRHGELPTNMEVHHKCENKRCLNVDHMEALPKPEHTRETGRMRTRKRMEEIYPIWASLGFTNNSGELGRALGVSQGSAWYLLQKLREFYEQ